MNSSNKRAFTLIEMLTIIGIIVILGSLTLTGVMKSRKYSYKMTCMNNLKSLHSISLLYFQDYNSLPTYDLINKITNNSEKFICPAKKHDNNELLVNYNTIQTINISNQFVEIDSSNHQILFSDVDIEAILLNPINAEINNPAPHNGNAFGILTSGQFREFTISQIITTITAKSLLTVNKVKTSGKPAK